MRDKSIVKKHLAIQVAILMPRKSEARICIVGLIQLAYADSIMMNIDILNHRLEKFCKNEHPQCLVDVNYYMLCLRMEMKHQIQTKMV